MLRRTNDVCEYAKTIYNEYFPDLKDTRQEQPKQYLDPE